MNRQSFLRAVGAVLFVPYLPRLPKAAGTTKTVPLTIDDSIITASAGTWSNGTRMTYKWWRTAPDGTRTLVSEQSSYRLTGADIGSGVNLEMRSHGD